MTPRPNVNVRHFRADWTRQFENHYQNQSRCFKCHVQFEQKFAENFPAIILNRVPAQMNKICLQNSGSSGHKTLILPINKSSKNRICVCIKRVTDCYQILCFPPSQIISNWFLIKLKRPFMKPFEKCPDTCAIYV